MYWQSGGWWLVDWEFRVQSHEGLEVWQRSIDLVDTIYAITDGLPTSERYGLSSQMQRAAVSVPANIAEGAGRDSTKEFLRHLLIARGSLAELTTFLVIVQRRQFTPPKMLTDANEQCGTVGRLLSGLQRSLRNKLAQQ